MSDADDSTASKKPDAKGESITFTDAETKMVIAIMQNLKGGVNLDFDADAVAVQLGMKDGGSARSRWNTIKRTKINAAPAGGVDKSTPSKKKTTTPKKAAAAAANQDPDQTPVPEKRGRKPTATTEAADSEAETIKEETEMEE